MQEVDKEILSEREQFQDWAHEQGFCLDCTWSSEGMPFENDDTALAYSIWKASRAAMKSESSDLEIVQKAVIEKCGRAGCVVFHTGGWVVETDEYVIAEGNNNESLLTWAKQTIEGVE